MRKHTTALLIMSFLCCWPGHAALGQTTPSFRGIGDLAGGNFYSAAMDVSADGSVIVGYSLSASGDEAFRWTGGVMTGLGDLPGGVFQSHANAVSGDGKVVAGYGTTNPIPYPPPAAFRWTSNVMSGIGDLPGGIVKSDARGVSADGSVVVGYGTSASGDEGFRWQNGVMTGIGDLPGGAFQSYAHKVSADGSTIIGWSAGALGTEAFIWKDNVMTGLGDLPGGIYQSIGLGMSANGRVVVGWGRSGLSEASGPIATEAFRWEAGVMTALGDLPGGDFSSSAEDLSADGSILVGIGTGESGQEAVFWTADGQIHSLKAFLASRGIDMTSWQLSKATAVSADGMTIVGYGTNSHNKTEAWVAQIPEPATCGLLVLPLLTRILGRRRLRP